MKEFPKNYHTFFMEGPEGALEISTSWPKAHCKPITGIICHPHPLYGGTMNNKVVTTVAKTFDSLGFKTVRFNFRGVGKSEGSYDEGRGEQEDCETIVHWVKHVVPNDRIYLAGFSFGAYIAAAVANKDPTIARLITIAPVVTNQDYTVLNRIQCPWLIIAAEKDELIDVADVEAFVRQSPLKPGLKIIKDASHFFHGRLSELQENLYGFL